MTVEFEFGDRPRLDRYDALSLAKLLVARQTEAGIQAASRIRAATRSFDRSPETIRVVRLDDDETQELAAVLRQRSRKRPSSASIRRLREAIADAADSYEPTT